MSEVKAIIFDLGGVLIDWNPRYLYRKFFPDEETIDRFLQRTGLLAWNEQMDAGRPFAEGVAELSNLHPEYKEEISAFHTRWGEMLEGEIASSVNILKELRKAGYPLYALSNWSSETFPLAKRRFDFLGWFREVVISGEHGMIKPDPAIFQLMLARIGFSAADCVYIDDSLKNYEKARDLGFRAIHFRPGEGLASSLQELGVKF